MTFAEYLRVGRRWWWVVVLGAVLAGAVAYAVTSVLPKEYSARATLLVGGSNASPGVAETYARLLTSSTHVDRVSGALDNRSRSELTSAVSVRVLPQTLLIEVSATDRHAEEAATVANAFADNFPGYLNDAGLGDGGKAVVVSRANVPRHPSSPDTTSNVILGVVLGFLLMCGAVGVIEYLDDAVEGQEAFRRLGVPVLGEIPLVPAPEGADVAQFVPSLRELALDEGLVAAFERLQHVFGLAAETAGARTVLITSPVSGDGKTTTVANLAQALASRSRHVLVVDAHLAKPALHRYFGLGNAEGLSTALGRGPGAAPLDEVADGLAILTAGPPPGDPRRQLASQALTAVFDELSLEADIVLIDGPAVLESAPQVASLLAVADAVVLVARVQATRRGQLEDAVTALSASGVPLIGAVMNGASHGMGRKLQFPRRAYTEPVVAVTKVTKG